MSVREKLRTNLELDWQLLTTPPPPGGSRLSSLFHKYASIARDRREVRFMGRPFRYDNRFTPALLPGYLHEVHRLGRHVPLASIATVVDVGANTGQLAFALKLYRPDASVWSFEPNPEAFELLRANAARFADWHAVCSGVGAARKAPLYFVRGKSSQGSVFERNATMNLDASEVTQVEADIAPLDEARARALGIPARVDLLKIDVEGAELDALEHVTGVKPRWVLMEISVGREGTQPVSAFTGAMKRLWGTEPVTVWRSEPRPSHATQDFLWSVP